MANANTEVSLDALHAAILAKITDKFPVFKTVDAYLEDRKALPTPAFLLEMSEFETGDADDPGTGQLAVYVRFEARLVVGFRTPRAKLEVRKMAAAVALFARLERWGTRAGPAEVIGAWPDDFGPELDQYECWRVEWRQEVHLGASVWKDEGITPASPLFSFAPDIGIPHRDKYKPLDALLQDGPP